MDTYTEAAVRTILALRRPLLPHGYRYKASCARPS